MRERDKIKQFNAAEMRVPVCSSLFLCALITLRPKFALSPTHNKCGKKRQTRVALTLCASNFASSVGKRERALLIVEVLIKLILTMEERAWPRRPFGTKVQLLSCASAYCAQLAPNNWNAPWTLTMRNTNAAPCNQGTLDFFQPKGFQRLTDQRMQCLEKAILDQRIGVQPPYYKRANKPFR